MVRLCLAAVLGATAAFGNTVTYNYTGTHFTTCTYYGSGLDACPGDFTSDYILASVTFDAPLPANQPLTDYFYSPSLLGWTIGDALGYFSYSSTDADAASELTYYLTNEPNLSLSTDSGGAIASYIMEAGKTGGILARQY